MQKKTKAKKMNQEEEKILGVGKRNFTIYITGLIISFTFLIPFLVNPTFSLFVILSSTGASGIGASLLTYFIDRNAEIKKTRKNSLLMEYSNTEIRYHFISLLIVLNRVINSISKQVNNMEYMIIKDKDVIETVNIIINEVSKIKLLISPVVAQNREITMEESEQIKSAERARKIIENSENSLIKIRKRFDLEKEKFQITKTILLVGEIADENEITMVQLLLDCLGTPAPEGYIYEQSLIQFAESLDEFFSLNLELTLKILNFQNLRFDNEKGYLSFKNV